jgi:hypothetical protein
MSDLVRAVSFQPVSFYDKKQKKQVVILYALGSDGIIREFVNGKWNQYPIKEE